MLDTRGLPMIVLDKVTKRFGPKILFENVSIQFDPGKRYGVAGANGAGKSTLLEMLSGLDDWDQGSIDVWAAIVHDDTAHRNKEFSDLAAFSKHVPLPFLGGHDQIDGHPAAKHSWSCYNFVGKTERG